ncbi:hypothetical protein AGMMS49938_03940 [Fibrobacterales bacterium]|nr:hypothetical protein AGMMS49938_03940 [Fibrobacterales bacterium]
MSKDNDELQKDERIQRSVQTAVFYQGNIPHPDIMLGLKRVDESFPERIMKITEENANVSVLIAKENIKSRTRGQWLTVLLFALILGIATLFVFVGKQETAIAALIAGFGTIATAAIKGVNGR